MSRFATRSPRLSRCLLAGERRWWRSFRGRGQEIDRRAMTTRIDWIIADMEASLGTLPIVARRKLPIAVAEMRIFTYA